MVVPPILSCKQPSHTAPLTEALAEEMKKYRDHFILRELRNGNCRLLLLVEQVVQDPKCFNFHEILMQREEGDSWNNMIRITEKEIQKNNPTRRYISDIYSFDPNKKVAIVMIGEGDRPEGSGSINIVYSWREWDINKNVELSYFRKCKSPHEPFQ